MLGAPEAFLTTPGTCRNKGGFVVRVRMMRELAPHEYDEARCCLRHRNTFLKQALGTRPSVGEQQRISFGAAEED